MDVSLKPDQVNMAVLFWYLVKIDLLYNEPHVICDFDLPEVETNECWQNRL